MLRKNEIWKLQNTHSKETGFVCKLEWAQIPINICLETGLADWTLRRIKITEQVSKYWLIWFIANHYKCLTEFSELMNQDVEAKGEK